MRTIFDDISTAFTANNVGAQDGVSLQEKYFSSYTSLTEYAQLTRYSTEMLCFSYGFDTFEPATH
jgi:hypothetical protein